jgi:hypothetical protein
MTEYEYEVKFYGSQWLSSVLVYHELDDDTQENREQIIGWFESVADQLGLTITEYHEAIITKTGELGAGK